MKETLRQMILFLLVLASILFLRNVDTSVVFNMWRGLEQQQQQQQLSCVIDWPRNYLSSFL
jgi:hypothetical protein